MHDVGHHEGIDFLVMEFLEGETLADRIAARPAHFRRSRARLGRPAGQTLAAAGGKLT